MKSPQKIQTTLEKEFEKVLSPFQAFIKDQTTSSILLVVCTIIALLIANSPLSGTYSNFLSTPLGFAFGDSVFAMSLRHWINDGLMSFFFFLLGMEIKREILVGEMRDRQRLVPVLSAAIGGMLVPALIFYSINMHTEYAHGWGIPMATDTAFAVGVLAMLGRSVPVAAFAFLTALAIIDDIGAILVIAIFYTESINLPNLLIGFALLLVLVVFNALGIRRSSIYLLCGSLIWLAMLGSGVHATVAGVLVAATVPARPKRGARWFVSRIEKLLSKFIQIEKQKPDTSPILAEAEQHSVVEYVQEAAEKTTTPLRRWESVLEHPVSLFVLPLFALANAGVVIDTSYLSQLWENSLVYGIILGLLVGKGVGIPLFVYAAVRLKLGKLPGDLNMAHVAGLGMLGGMGFTMSIFISQLGFAGNEAAIMAAKMAILIASLAAGITGYMWLRLRGK